MIPNRKPVGKSSVNDTNWYAHLDKLKKSFDDNPCTLVELMDEVMGISKDNILDRIKRFKAHANFVSDLGDNFTIGVLIYSRKSTLWNWYAVWRMERIQDDKHTDFISMCVNATKSAPEYLLQRQSNDDIDTIARALGRSKRLCKEIISDMMPDGCVPQFTKPEKETQFLEDAVNLILPLDNDYEKKLITDMIDFNCHVNTDKIKYNLCWEFCICVVDLENGPGAHHRCKAAADTDTTTNVSFAPGLILITRVAKSTINIIEK